MKTTLFASVVARRISMLVAVAMFAACGGGGDGPTTGVIVPVASVSLTLPPGTITAAQSYQLTAVTKDANGGAITGRPVTWSSSNLNVATISNSGQLEAIRGGSTTITATSEGQSGSLQVTIAPAPVASVELSAPSTSVYVGDQLQLALVLKDARGTTLGVRPTTWTSSSNGIAVVSGTGLVTAVSAGAVTITARSESRTGTFDLTVAVMPAPTVTSAPAMQSGQSAIITGDFFAPDVFGNIVTIRGERATVTAATRTQLTVQVPCLATGTASVSVTRAGQQSAPATTNVAGPQIQLAVGQSQVMSTGTCVEFPVNSANDRYLVTVFNTSLTVAQTSGVILSGNQNLSAASAAQRIGPAPSVARVSMPRVTSPMRGSVETVIDPKIAAHEREHGRHLDRMREIMSTLRGRDTKAPAARTTAAVVPVAVGDERSFRYNFNSCSDNAPPIQAKAIFVGTFAVIWEDVANTLQSATDASLLQYYTRLAQIYDAEQHASVAVNFGDPLLRDAATDADGKIHMVFTQRLNGTGAAAYVHPCDQYPNGIALGGGQFMTNSNFGQYFYAQVPVSAGSNVNSTSFADGWFNFMVRTVIHEVKHISSISARVANNAPATEESWLEEGTARMAEEMWIRESLHKTNWKANTGWSTAAQNGLYCDFHPADATCLAADPLRRPSFGMRRQFHEIRPQLLSPWDYSPFGNVAGQVNATFYNSTWSLVRYTMDRFASSEATFLNALTNSTLTGVANLVAVSGVSFERLLSGWGMALYADDYPGMPNSNLDTQFQTWNLRSIYGGLNQSDNWKGTYNTPFPLKPASVAFGAFESDVVNIRGGATAYFELSGTATTPQFVQVRSQSGGAPAPTIKMAVLRLQ